MLTERRTEGLTQRSSQLLVIILPLASPCLQQRKRPFSFDLKDNSLMLEQLQV